MGRCARGVHNKSKRRGVVLSFLALLQTFIVVATQLRYLLFSSRFLTKIVILNFWFDVSFVKIAYNVLQLIVDQQRVDYIRSHYLRTSFFISLAFVFIRAIVPH